MPPRATSSSTTASNAEQRSEPPTADSPPHASMESRQARLSTLRAQMAASTKANRKDILTEQSRTRALASQLKPPSASRKLQNAQTLLEERDLRESGHDVERHRNLHYSLEESERWDARLEERQRRRDCGPADFGDAAERAYQRQLRVLKPDVARYRQLKGEMEARKAAGPAGGVLTVARGKGKGKGREVQAYGEGGEMDEIHYGTHTPSDDAIDRVVNHLNHEKQLIKNRSRTRHDDPDAQVNYINDSNKHFNKKLKRFYDKQTQEIRDNLERGTAL